MVDALGDERELGHESESIDEILEPEPPVELAIDELPVFELRERVLEIFRPTVFLFCVLS